MAGLRLHNPSGEIALTGGTAKTAISVLAAANHRVLL